MKSLQEITDTWGRWMAKGHSTTMWWTASTQYKDQKPLKDYMEHEVVASSRFHYEAGRYLPPTDLNMDRTRYENNSDVAQRQGFTHLETVERSFHWSKTESLVVNQTPEALIAGVTAPQMIIAIGADGRPAYVSGDRALSAPATARRPNQAA